MPVRNSRATSLFARVIALWIIIATATHAFAADKDNTGAGAHLDKAEIQWLADHPEIRLGVDPQWQPFEYFDKQGKYAGMGADYLGIVSRALGVELTPQPGRSWPQVLDAIQARELDVIPLIAPTSERSAYLNFTRPYLSTPMVIFVEQRKPFISGLDNLRGAKVGVVKGYVTEAILRQNHQELALHPVATVEEGMKAIAAGDLDAFVGYLATGSHTIGRLNLLNVKVAAQTPYVLALSMAVRKDWPQLIPILEKALDTITPQAESRIRARWSSVRFDHGVDFASVLVVALPAAVVLLLIIAAFIFANRRLRTEIADRISAEKAMHLAKDEAEYANQAKSDFLSSISHEFRTPLNSIMGFSQLLQSDRKSPLDDTQAEAVGHIYSAGKHLHELISELLDLTKIQSRQLEINFASVEVTGLIRDCIDMTQPLTVNNNLEIVFDRDAGNIADNLLVRADPLRLRQVMLNLLSNAIKYNRQDGKVFVTIETPDSECCRVLVRDTGDGVPPDQKNHVFLPFERLGADKKSIDGTGIGLTVSRNLVEMMDGQLDFTSEEGVGSTFWIDLPLMPAERDSGTAVETKKAS
jgi:polar amino acid transport system substrate-binding protein